MEQTDPTSQDDEDGDEVTHAPARRGRLNAPQLQAQLSRLSDLGCALKDTLLVNGRGKKLREMKTCATRTSLINGFTS